MKKSIFFLIVSIMISCKHELKEGIITNMHVEPARDYMYMMPISHTRTVGKITTTYYTYIPVYMHDDADYVISIHGLTEGGEEKDETFYLTQSKFNSLRLGQRFCVTPDCSDEPNKDSKINQIKL